MNIVERNSYHVKDIASGMLIAVEDFIIYEYEDRYVAESKMNLFGSNGFSQKGKFEYSRSWILLAGTIDVDTQNISADFRFSDSSEVNFQIKQNGVEHQVQVIHCDQEKSFAYFTGAIGIPFFWTRMKRYYSDVELYGIPTGSAYVRRKAEKEYKGELCDILDFQLQVGTESDNIMIWVNKEGVMVRGESTKQNVLLEILE